MWHQKAEGDLDSEVMLWLSLQLIILHEAELSSEKEQGRKKRNVTTMIWKIILKPNAKRVNVNYWIIREKTSRWQRCGLHLFKAFSHILCTLRYTKHNVLRQCRASQMGVDGRVHLCCTWWTNEAVKRLTKVSFLQLSYDGVKVTAECRTQRTVAKNKVNQTNQRKLLW